MKDEGIDRGKRGVREVNHSYRFGQEICEVLFRAGYIAYFAGGWVRDYILGVKSDEIDIATSAPPEIILGLFPKTIPVGIQFGVVIVVFKGVNFEIATFRKDHTYLDGRHPTGVDFSSPEKDAQRRDFTINGMFFDPLTETIYDYVGGEEDLKKGVIRAIGDPSARFSEDRLRMVRAVRFSARFGFQLEEKSAVAISTLAQTLLPAVSMERIWQELCKMAAYPRFSQALLQLFQLGLLSTIFPQLSDLSDEQVKKFVAPFDSFPIQTPPIVYIMELFPHMALQEKKALCHYLKTTHNDVKIVEFFDSSQKLFSQLSLPLHQWAHFYAHPFSTLYIEIVAAKMDFPKNFLKTHSERAQQLSRHIERIQQRKPLVRAKDLLERGIQPGVEMGLLLKEAEKMAIDGDLHHKEEVLRMLIKKM